eukprot:CAMPEP_0176442142 /NCGR_PEP_ID=MMETSP0127-20121128/21628_1 /TAXON_ID=938130 /ORGANISM="Platyophrya macrostoma, Strain WH" /LENGTH=224 /DNA_ID=CAMNT_0017827077 /DNA_START=18 /DNA_END=692 /DNA_ORIENTATION=-
MEPTTYPKDKIILYSYHRSSASWRVRNVLALKGIKYEYSAINLLKDEQKGDEYAKLNPMKRVPAIIIDGELLTESLPIMEYLDETRPEKKVYPADPILRAKVRAVCEICNSGMQPLQNLSVLRKIEKEYGQDQNAFATQFNIDGFKALESMLSKTAGKYCFGDEITAADCVVLPQVYGSSMRFGIKLEEYPTLDKIIKNLLEVQAFKDALPASQIDSPDYKGPQ